MRYSTAATGRECASEGDAGGNLGTVHHCVEQKATVLVVSAERPVTNFREDGSGEVDTERRLDLPHQVGANSEPSNFATHGGVIRLVKIVTSAQSDIRIEPRIVSRDATVQLPVENRRELVRDLHLGRVNHPIDCRASSGSSQVKRINSYSQSRLFRFDKTLDNLSDFFANAPAQRADWNAWFVLKAI